MLFPSPQQGQKQRMCSSKETPAGLKRSVIEEEKQRQPICGCTMLFSLSLMVSGYCVFTYTFFFSSQKPSLFCIALYLCWQPSTLKSPWKAFHGFKHRSLKKSLWKHSPFDVKKATDQAGNWLQLLSALMLSVIMWGINMDFKFEGNVTKKYINKVK